jgi:signal transduction histidine kinase
MTSEEPSAGASGGAQASDAGGDSGNGNGNGAASKPSLLERLGLGFLVRKGLADSLRRKFVAYAMVAVTLVLLLIVATINLYFYSHICARADEQLEDIVESDGSFAALVQKHGEGEASILGLGDGLTEETPYELRFFSVKTDKDGTVVSCDVSRIVSYDTESAVEAAARIAGSASTKGFEGDMRYLISRESDGTVIYAFLDCSRDLAMFHVLTCASLLVMLAALLLVFVLVVVFSKSVVRPISEGYARQRRFITDASHDLKTPLAVISSSADVIEIESGSSEWVDSIRHQVERMTRLTNKLMILARMDEGQDAVVLEDMDLAKLVSNVADDFEPMCMAHGRSLAIDVDDEVPAHVDPAMVEQMLMLLLDNAIKYSTEGAVIRVSCVRSRKGHATIRIENPCDDMTKGEHPELFERFYRSDEARSEGDGNGIGLAVVKAATESLGGTVAAVSPDGSSLRIEIRL